MFRIGLLLAAACCCSAADIAAVKVEVSLETGSQAGKEIPVTLAYDASAVKPHGDCVVPAVPVGEGLAELERAQAAFHEGVMTSIKIFLRMEEANSPVHNLVIGAAGPDSLTYVDQKGGVGSGTYRVRPLPNSDALRVIRSIPEPLSLRPAIHPAGNPANPGLVIMGPELPGTNPLNVVHPAAAPGLVVTDPAPLTLPPPPPPPLK